MKKTLVFSAASTMYSVVALGCGFWVGGGGLSGPTGGAYFYRPEPGAWSGPETKL